MVEIREINRFMNRRVLLWLVTSIVPVIPFLIPLFRQAFADTPIAYLIWIPIVAFGWSIRKLSYTEENTKKTNDRYRWMGIFLSIGTALIWMVGAFYFGNFFFQFTFGLLLWGLWSISSALVYWGGEAVSAITFPMLYLTLGWPPIYMTLIDWVNPILSNLALRLLLSFTTLETWIQFKGTDIFSVVSRIGKPVLISVTYGCSGSDSVLTILVLFPVLFLLMRGNALLKIGLLIAGCLAVFILNIIRIFLIIFALHWIGYDFAFYVVHPLLGTVFFVMVIFIIALFGLRAPLTTAPPNPAKMSVLPSHWFSRLLIATSILVTIVLIPFYWHLNLIPISPLLLNSLSIL